MSSGASSGRHSSRARWGRGRGCLIAGIFNAILAAAAISGRYVDSTADHSNAPQTSVGTEKMHIVLSVFREDPKDIARYVVDIVSLPNVKKTEPRIFAYVKGNAAQLAAVREAGFADEVVEAPNIGRESETYFRHILSHYEKLPAHILFTQAQPQYDYSVPRLGKYFGEKTGLLGLCSVTTCTCEGFSNHWHGPKHAGYIRIRELWALSRGSFCPQEFACSHNGIFVVSRQRILSQPLSLYKYMSSLFFIDQSHILRHNEDDYHNNQDEAPATENGWFTLGHVVERSWYFIFNCTDTKVSDRCWDGAGCGTPEDCTTAPNCQCLDE